MELLRSTSRGGFFVRSIFTFVLAVLMTVLLWTLAVPANTQAQGPKADWNGDSILYNGNQYYQAEPAKAGESHGLAEGTVYYVSVVQPEGSNASERKAYVIYFAPGNSPPDATTANYVEYDYPSNNTFENPQNQKTISVTPQSESGSYSSCSVDGIGWFICPVTVFLAEAMDWVFNVISGFLNVQPLVVNDPNSDLYVAWNVMRSIANIAFIIAFLIIIYSQLTSWGVSNYGLKKLLPRLIVAAILVNLSFFISAIAVDLSNIAGYSLQEILIQIRQDTFNIDNQTWSAETSNWAGVTAAVLSGGAITAGVVGLSVAGAGGIGGVAYLLIPLLIGLLLTVLFVLLILAARQAIIIILIVLAPLAFVANLLPNTEKWFEKWKDLFMTMLIFFPAFSLVFGGSQLAGGIIIQNATDIIMMIFGMAVQVAPLIITPLLLKLSGGLLGRIASLINDPRRGMLDRTKKWAGDRAEMSRLNSLRKPGGANPFRRIAQRMDNGQRRVKERTDLYGLMNDNRYNATDGHHALHEQHYEAKKDGEIIEANMNRSIQNRVNTAGSRLQTQNLQLEAAKLALERTVQVTASDVAEYKAGKTPASDAPEALQQAARTLNLERQSLAIEKMRGASAEGVQQERFADALMKDMALQKRAGGIDEHGADAALASAISTVRESYGKSINEARAIIKHFNFSSEQRQMHALGQEFSLEKGGVVRTFTASDIFTREAAIEDQVATGTIPQVEQLVAASGSNLAQFKTTISDAIAKNGLGGKTLYLGGKTIDDIAQGRIKNENDLMAVVVETIAKGKISEKDLASIDKDAVAKLADAAALIKSGAAPDIDPSLAKDLDRRLEEFSKLAQDTLTGDERVNVKPNSKEHILRVARLTDPTFNEQPLPRPPQDPPQV